MSLPEVLLDGLYRVCKRLWQCGCRSDEEGLFEVALLRERNGRKPPFSTVVDQQAKEASWRSPFCPIVLGALRGAFWVPLPLYGQLLAGPRDVSLDWSLAVPRASREEPVGIFGRGRLWCSTQVRCGRYPPALDPDA